MVKKQEVYLVSLSLACKLASIVGHVQEGSGIDGHPYDWVTLGTLTADPEVVKWMAEMTKRGLTPAKRRK